MNTPALAVINLQPRPQAEVDVLFLHHAGGSSFPYLQLGAGLCPRIEAFAIDLPGRGTNFGHPLQCEAAPTIAGILAAVLARGLGSERPLLLVGHSLGAELAFQVATALLGHVAADALQVVLSARGCQPRSSLPARDLSDRGILALLDRHGATPQEVLEDPALRQFVLATMRSDLLLLEQLERLPRHRLPCRAHLVGGDRDVDVNGALAGWRPLFAACDAPALLDGGHFYLFDDPHFVPWLESRALALSDATASHAEGSLYSD
ncbi:MAG: alpha/beta fold hydrolase [Xanthomonas sp.]